MRPLVETDATGNLRFPSNKGNPWFHKRRQLLIGVHDETLSRNHVRQQSSECLA